MPPNKLLLLGKFLVHHVRRGKKILKSWVGGWKMEGGRLDP